MLKGILLSIMENAGRQLLKAEVSFQGLGCRTGMIFGMNVHNRIKLQQISSIELNYAKSNHSYDPIELNNIVVELVF
jgi:hypothetical protein